MTARSGRNRSNGSLPLSTTLVRRNFPKSNQKFDFYKQSAAEKVNKSAGCRNVCRYPGWVWLAARGAVLCHTDRSIRQTDRMELYNPSVMQMVAGGGMDPHINGELAQGFENLVCVRCNDHFNVQDQMVNSSGQVWHSDCFVCAQCFQPFPDGIYFEFEGRKYCEHDFHVLYAPCCGKCNEFIVGRVIKAMNASWHPHCFCCEICNRELADIGFLRNAGRALCRDCNEREKAAGAGRYVCHKCNAMIDDGQHIKFRGDSFHPYHFKCKRCNVELTVESREVGGELYCLRCHDTMGIPICGACHRPIEERVVTALGKNWHVEHFVCSVCEKPFLGHRHYERKGLAYCDQHYHKLFGNLCFKCNEPCGSEVFQALQKSWCLKCFSCSFCDKKMDQKTKFYEFDMKPTCKRCYDRFPTELKKRISDSLKDRDVETQRHRSVSPSKRNQV